MRRDADRSANWMKFDKCLHDSVNLMNYVRLIAFIDLEVFRGGEIVFSYDNSILHPSYKQNRELPRLVVTTVQDG
jgi:hypothetical protein